MSGEDLSPDVINLLHDFQRAGISAEQQKAADANAARTVKQQDFLRVLPDLLAVGRLASSAHRSGRLAVGTEIVTSTRTQKMRLGMLSRNVSYQTVPVSSFHGWSLARKRVSTPGFHDFVSTPGQTFAGSGSTHAYQDLMLGLDGLPYLAEHQGLGGSAGSYEPTFYGKGGGALYGFRSESVALSSNFNPNPYLLHSSTPVEALRDFPASQDVVYAVASFIHANRLA